MKYKNSGVDIIWRKIRQVAKIIKIDENAVRRYFEIKKNEVHKYLKAS